MRIIKQFAEIMILFKKNHDTANLIFSSLVSFFMEEYNIINTGRTTCIIPFYNEGERIFEVLNTVTQISRISQIICVDDGSSDGTADLIEQRFPQIEVVRLSENQGKTAAIRHGLTYAKQEYVLLMDADLQMINQQEISFALQAIETYDIDMIILRRINAPWFVKMDRGDVLFSGERVLKRTDLEKVLHENVCRYQIEIAINNYMLKHNKTVFWVPSSAFNTFKVQKIGLIDGFIKELDMFFDIILFAGLQNYFRQISSFARKRYVSYNSQSQTSSYKLLHNRESKKKSKPFSAKTV